MTPATCTRLAEPRTGKILLEKKKSWKVAFQKGKVVIPAKTVKVASLGTTSLYPQVSSEAVLKLSWAYIRKGRTPLLVWMDISIYFFVSILFSRKLIFACFILHKITVFFCQSSHLKVLLTLDMSPILLHKRHKQK